MKVLITGGLGMIGSCLAAAYLRDGHQVLVYDNEEIGAVSNLNYHLSSDEVANVEVIRADVLERERLARALEGVNLCFHMAATLGTIRVVHEPRRMMRVNITGTQNAIDLCVERKIPIVIASTSMVYGNNPAPVVHEEDALFVDGDLSRGLWWYAVSKLADEAYARSTILECPECKILTVRPFNVVAPLQKGMDGFVLPRFIRAAIEGEPLLVYGDGSQRRTFLWVTDFVDSLVRVVQSGHWNETVNIGSTEEISILDLAQLVVRMSGSSSPVKLIEPQTIFRNQFAEIGRRIPDLRRLHELIGESRSTPIEEIVRRFLVNQPQLAREA